MESKNFLKSTLRENRYRLIQNTVLNFKEWTSWENIKPSFKTVEKIVSSSFVLSFLIYLLMLPTWTPEWTHQPGALGPTRNVQIKHCCKQEEVRIIPFPKWTCLNTACSPDWRRAPHHHPWSALQGQRDHEEPSAPCTGYGKGPRGEKKWFKGIH